MVKGLSTTCILRGRHLGVDDKKKRKKLKNKYIPEAIISLIKAIIYGLEVIIRPSYKSVYMPTQKKFNANEALHGSSRSSLVV